MYSLIRPLLFKMDAEKAHHLSLKALHIIPKFCFTTPQSKPVKAMGYEFPNPIGLAAGLDKNAQHLDALSKLGFGFLEVGTVTPRPQLGNNKPRLFRLPEARALINRMGFNNHGVHELIEHIQRAHYQGILGINIGKNKDTSLQQASDDYLTCFKAVYPYASYVTINISSPNTPDLRKLQQGNFFIDLMSELRDEQLQLSDKHQRYVPLVVKVSPDEEDDDLKRMADVILSQGIDGIIATNTTSNREKVEHLPYGKESGGLSGRPLAHRSTHCLRLIKSVVGNQVCLIASGGIDNLDAAHEKLAAGANLLQLYTGLVYQGPSLVTKLINNL
ncbi:quinone-dependent dihydroorotate dehydrogenase [Legionella impletisoli]|uniref:Dihydroorotate dehydrogenase (quinone) n=1 Tax=Legionella impletisoli TaxID=343510 RepID=A0A917JNS1_9GAMM|nr:quinone-dependent dihydroorotate dehydrogenase [Legionella impletisoli]GGI79287.1 dihydroorotate dehydrogenase (quinone) [Legionella impletisoli]